MFTHLIADGLMLPIVLLAAWVLIVKVPKSERYDRYTRIVMAGATSYIVAQFIGTVWQPEAERPFELLGATPGAAFLDNPGFPSDHALFAAFLTLAVWYVSRSKLLTGSMVVLTLVMCVGRVVALVHTPLDIAGGLVIACLGSVWYFESRPRIFRRRLAKKTKK